MYKIYYIDNENPTLSFDLSEIVHNISHFTTINCQPAKLTFSIEDHFNNPLFEKINVGSRIIFFNENVFGVKNLKSQVTQIFSGTIFNWNKSKDGSFEVTCYDDLRYFSNPDDWYMTEKTADTAFSYICSKLGLIPIVKQPSTTILKNYLFLEKTYWEMMEHIIEETLVENYSAGNSVLNYYFLKSTVAGIVFDTINNNMTDLIIGDESLLMDYDYSEDIDSDTFNDIIIVKSVQEDNLGSQGERVITTKMDNLTQQKWGVLRKMISIKDESDKTQIEKYAELFLQLKNRIKKSIKVTALGYDGIEAGSGFIFKLDRLKIFQKMYVISATHNYEMDKHTMELEVNIV